eukprot:2330816-Pleurochrysis_carterae.AAC.1
MFQKQGIRTYLNDELRIVIPNCNHVCIRENSANYPVMLAPDTFVYVVTNESDTVERARGQVGQLENLVHADLASAISPSTASTPVKHVRGIEKQLRHTHPNCRAFMIGGARKPSTKQPTTRQFSYYGE